MPREDRYVKLALLLASSGIPASRITAKRGKALHGQGEYNATMLEARELSEYSRATAVHRDDAGMLTGDEDTKLVGAWCALRLQSGLELSDAYIDASLPPYATCDVERGKFMVRTSRQAIYELLANTSVIKRLIVSAPSVLRVDLASAPSYLFILATLTIVTNDDALYEVHGAIVRLHVDSALDAIGTWADTATSRKPDADSIAVHKVARQGFITSLDSPLSAGLKSMKQ
jgi:hypothetical protein